MNLETLPLEEQLEHAKHELQIAQDHYNHLVELQQDQENDDYAYEDHPTRPPDSAL